MRCMYCQHEQSSEEYFCQGCGEALLEGKEIGSFRLIERIGSGGMGIVYRAEHSRLKTPYAIKLLSPEIYTQEVEKKRFLREAQATAQLRHEHIVFIADFGEVKGLGLYLVMEYLQGKTLKKATKSGQTLSLERVWNIAHQISKTMDYAHAQGIIHRDLKPENIFLLDRPEAQDDFIKIFDFGIAKLSKEPNLQITQTGSFLGTPAYMSPEQMQGKVDPRTDIYALGVILFRILTGQRPFSYNSLAELIQAKLNRDAPVLSSLIPAYAKTEWEALVAACLQREPAKRPASMKEVQLWLERMEKDPTCFSIAATRGSLPPSPLPFAISELPSSEPSDSSSSSPLSLEQKLPTPSHAGNSARPVPDFSELSITPAAPQKQAKAMLPQTFAGPLPDGLPSIASSLSVSGANVRWHSSSAMTVVLFSLLIGAVAGWFFWLRPISSSGVPANTTSAQRSVSTQTLPNQKESTPQPSKEPKQRATVTDPTIADQQGKQAGSGITPELRRPVSVRGNRTKVSAKRKSPRTQQRPHTRNRPRKALIVQHVSTDAIQNKTHAGAQNMPQPQELVPKPMNRVVEVSGETGKASGPCPAPSGLARWVYIRIKNPKIVPPLKTSGAWKKPKRGRGWCIQVGSGARKVTLDGNEYNLATCEFQVSLQTPSVLPVLLRDPDDVVSFSDYCLR